MKISSGATFRSKFRYRFTPLVFAVIWVAASCSTGDRQIRSDSDGVMKDPSYSQAKTVEKRILQEVRSWYGTRHKMGGNSSRGVDCSGFVQRIYRDAFKVDLPRTTREQLKCGTAVRRGELQPGDLVFFKPPGYPRHVGIYLSHSNFAMPQKQRASRFPRLIHTTGACITGPPGASYRYRNPVNTLILSMN